MRTRFVVYLIGIVLFLAALPARAHHSVAAEFDLTKTVSLKGTVTKIEWMNPHSYLYMDVKDEVTGKAVNWAVQLGSSNWLVRHGWTRNSAKVGDVLTVDGARARDGSRIIHTTLIPHHPGL
jgi:hypothetical protein